MNATKNNTTNHAITKTLHATCQQYAITPLYACESGSRAWGFDSFDSDFDVRLIYKHSPDWYMSLYDQKDTVEFINHEPFDVPFDVGGWDIKKTLIHIHKSNAVIFEWLNSPIVYHRDDDFMRAITPVLMEFFNPKTAYHHYQGMAKKISAHLDLNHPVNLKTWCYLIRALLASLWLKEHQSIPPVLITAMFEPLDSNEKDELNAIIALKHQHDEYYSHQLSKSLVAFTQKLWQNTQDICFDDKKKGDVELLTHIFKTSVFNP